jgi:hypothetical protein
MLTTMPSSSRKQVRSLRNEIEKAGDEMIRGLQITMRADELSRRITERICVHQAAMSALDARINQRAGDAPFDVRPEDGFKTVGELQTVRDQIKDRVLQLTLLRDNLVAGEVYALRTGDLRLAELISSDAGDASAESCECWSDDRKNPAIEGLKLTMPGAEL